MSADVAILTNEDGRVVDLVANPLRKTETETGAELPSKPLEAPDKGTVYRLRDLEHGGPSLGIPDDIHRHIAFQDTLGGDYEIGLLPRCRAEVGLQLLSVVVLVPLLGLE